MRGDVAGDFSNVTGASSSHAQLRNTSSIDKAQRDRELQTPRTNVHVSRPLRYGMELDDIWRSRDGKSR